MTALFFLALFAAAVVFGWWLGTCWARGGREIDTVLDDVAIDSEADRAERGLYMDWRL